MRVKLARIHRILNMVKEIELGRLTKIVDEQRRLGIMIERVKQEKEFAESCSQQAQTLSVAQLLGADAKWGRVMDAKIRQATGKLALLSADAEEQKIRTRVALGRVEAFQNLTAQQLKRRHRR